MTRPTYADRLNGVCDHNAKNASGNFERAEGLNRQLFKLVYDRFFANTGDHLWSYAFCPANGHLPFDAVVCCHSRLTGKMTQRLLIEMKARGAEYESYKIEGNKYRNITTTAADTGSKAIYLNFTAYKAYFWDLSGMPTPEFEDTIVDESNVVSSHKITKKNALLKVTDCSVVLDYDYSLLQEDVKLFSVYKQNELIAYKQAADLMLPMTGFISK